MVDEPRCGRFTGCVCLSVCLKWMAIVSDPGPNEVEGMHKKDKNMEMSLGCNCGVVCSGDPSRAGLFSNHSCIHLKL